MDAASPLADLTEISSQVEAAVVLGAEGDVLASTIASEPGTDRLAQAGRALLDDATSRFGNSGRSVTQLEAALRDASVFVAREGDLVIVARTSAHPSSGLVLYDLRSCLRAVAEATEKPKPRRRTKKAETTGA